MTQVFISYSRADKDFVRQLQSALNEVNRAAWVDWKDIPLTAEWRKEIYAGIEAADDFVFVISPESVASASCLDEVAYAAKNNKRLIPILRRPVVSSELPEYLSKINFIYFREEDGFQSTFRELLDALDTDLEWKKEHTRFLVRSRQWEDKKRDNSLCLRGTDLTEAEEWVAASTNKQPEPTSLQRSFILASRRAQSSRQRITLVAVTIALVVAITLAVITWTERNLAKEQAATAESRALASEAQQLFGTDSPDGKVILTTRLDHTAQVWNTVDAKLRGTLQAHIAPTAPAVFSPNSEYVLTGGDDDTARLWTLDGRLLTTLHHSGSILGVAFSRDGDRIVTASTSGTARVFRVVTLAQVADLLTK